MKKALVLTMLALAALSCGTGRRQPVTPQAPVQLPLEDPAEIARSEERAKEVLDSIEREKTMPPAARPAQPAPPREETLPLADQVIAYARSFTGTPYKLGASGPRQFDCSSFTSYVFRHFGYDITSYSQRQFHEGREVAGYSELQKGDLVFFGKRGKVRDIGHVGIVVSVDHERGSFTFIHASVSKGVTEDTSSQPYFLMRYMGARRILPDQAH